MALSIPALCHQTRDSTGLMVSIIALARMYNLNAIKYSLTDLLFLAPGTKKQPKKGLMKNL
jgi:hypothetical protein